MRLLGNLRVISAVVAAGAVLSAAAIPAASAASTPAAAAAAAASPSAPHLPAAGNPTGHAYVPPAARAVNTSHPNHVIGHGTPAGCTSAAVVRAVARGGVITFNCGPNPVTITMTATAKVVNTSQRVVLDGGGKVILSGGGKRRILYMNTCDQHQVWTTSHCQDQATPRLTVQNLTFANGRVDGHDITSGSGGAIYAQGGEFKVINSRFINNRCYAKGPDLGGAAIRAYEEWPGRPVCIVHSTFSGGVCSNGGALSSIGVSWTVLNSVLSRNSAIGWGANPASSGTPGGGSGGAIFFVSDDLTGTLHIDHSTLHDNPSAGFHNFPGTIFYLGHGKPVVTHSTLDG